MLSSNSRHPHTGLKSRTWRLHSLSLPPPPTKTCWPRRLRGTLIGRTVSNLRRLRWGRRCFWGSRRRCRCRVREDEVRDILKARLLQPLAFPHQRFSFRTVPFKCCPHKMTKRDGTMTISNIGAIGKLMAAMTSAFSFQKGWW
ncbi:hypothetical protein BDQ17DRAFT_1385369 [Cyathus striatus]|nr:hypothetical protein BDQ17DRAFT_1385369 [Cyathus striatus]